MLMNWTKIVNRKDKGKKNKEREIKIKTWNDK